MNKKKTNNFYKKLIIVNSNGESVLVNNSIHAVIASFEVIVTNLDKNN